MFRFTIGGRTVPIDQIGNALMEAALKNAADQLQQQLSSVRHPETGEFPTVLVVGTSLDDFSLRVEGSPELIAMIRQKFSAEDLDRMTLVEKRLPKAFLSFTTENLELAKQVAENLQSNGIDTWWSEWMIRAGDSLRQRIDEGLSECTHFIVLLTPESIGKPWVNQEMDAGLIRKLQSQAKFIALRHRLPASALPPLLKGMLSPSIDNFAEGVQQLINDIHELTRKPSLGVPPPAVRVPRAEYSPAAMAVAKIFAEDSQTGCFGDLQYTPNDLCARTGMTEEDISDALHEIRSMVKADRYRILINDQFFPEFDKYFMPWVRSTESKLQQLENRLEKPARPLPLSFAERDIQQFVEREATDFSEALAGDRLLARQELQKRIGKLVLTPSTENKGAFEVSGDVRLFVGSDDGMQSNSLEGFAQQYMSYVATLHGLELNPALPLSG